ncbi:MAG: hypothetical protein ACRC3H_16740 [Lachnospiraceae bacterium]
MDIYVCFVEHNNSTKWYLFDCSEVYNRINCGSKVVCETSKGIESGTVVTNPTSINNVCYVGGGNGVKEIIEATGAYLPLKKVLRVEGQDLKLTVKEKKMVALQWLNTQGMDVTSDDGLPFS